jgi:hypothetical protein
VKKKNLFYLFVPVLLITAAHFAVSQSLPTGKESLPDIEFDSENYRYFMTYQKIEDSIDRIKGVFLNPDGTDVGSEIDIESGTSSAYNPNAAYDPVTQRFLVVWHTFVSSEDADRVLGQIIDADGNKVGGQIDIGDLTNGNESNADVAYDSINERFLVVWESSPEVPEIKCQFINPDGTKEGSNFGVGAGSDQQEFPAVQFNASAGDFLVVWGVHISALRQITA